MAEPERLDLTGEMESCSHVSLVEEVSDRLATNGQKADGSRQIEM